MLVVEIFKKVGWGVIGWCSCYCFCEYRGFLLIWDCVCLVLEGKELEGKVLWVWVWVGCRVFWDFEGVMESEKF